MELGKQSEKDKQENQRLEQELEKQRVEINKQIQKQKGEKETLEQEIQRSNSGKKELEQEKEKDKQEIERLKQQNENMKKLVEQEKQSQSKKEQERKRLDEQNSSKSKQDQQKLRQDINELRNLINKKKGGPSFSEKLDQLEKNIVKNENTIVDHDEIIKSLLSLDKKIDQFTVDSKSLDACKQQNLQANSNNEKIVFLQNNHKDLSLRIEKLENEYPKVKFNPNDYSQVGNLRFIKYFIFLLILILIIYFIYIFRTLQI